MRIGMSGIDSGGESPEGHGNPYVPPYGGDMGNPHFLPQGADPGGPSTEYGPYGVDPAELTRNVLSAVAELSEQHEVNTARLEEIRGEMDVLRSRLHGLQSEHTGLQDMVNSHDEAVDGTLSMGRQMYYNVLPKTAEGYATGRDHVADAVRLSPVDGNKETPDEREARVRAVDALGSKIAAGQSVVVYERLGGSRDDDVYVGGVAEHDHFSLRLVQVGEDPHVNLFYVGVNGQTEVPLDNPASWFEGDNPSVHVYTGDEAGVFLNRSCNRLLGDWRAIDEELVVARQVDGEQEVRLLVAARRDVSEALTNVVSAAQRIGTPVEFEEGAQEYTVARLVEFMFDVGDGNAGPPSYIADMTQRVGQAIRHIYPGSNTPEGSAGLADLIVKASNTRHVRTHGGHKRVAVLDMLVDVLGIPRNEAIGRLYGPHDQ